MEFKNEIIYITGAAGQIGSLLTRKFLECGANVILVDNCIENLEEFKKSLKYPESRFLISQIDIANQNEVKDSIQKGIEKFGKITMQVNNAGASIFSPWFERSAEEIDLTMNVNLKGTFYCISEFLKAAKSQDINSVIVNVASHYGLISPDPRIYKDLKRRNSEIYGATKAGIIQMTKYFAANSIHDGFNTRINAIAPGGIFNPKHPQGKDFIKEYSSRVPLKRMGETEEVVKPILFLLSKDASYINGTTLIVDGGMSCW